MNIQQLKNAIAIIKQINNGEWYFKGEYEYNFEPEFTCTGAIRGDIELWFSGSSRCEVFDKPWEIGCFGAFVWWFAARSKAKELEKKMYRKTSNLTK